MGDAQAVFTRVPSLVARHHVTHVLSLRNDPPEWMSQDNSDGELKDVDEEEEEASYEKSTDSWFLNIGVR